MVAIESVTLGCVSDCNRLMFYLGNSLFIHTMADFQCPNCNFRRKLDDGEFEPFECPNCVKEDREWFAHWFLLVSFLGVIIFDSLMDPDTLTKNESFWDNLIGLFFGDISFGYWDFIIVVILFLIFLIGGALNFFLDDEPEDGMQFHDAVKHTDIETRDRDEEIDHNIPTWFDLAASKIYLQVGILIYLYPVTLFFPNFLGIFLVCLPVPFISWEYQRRSLYWKEREEQARRVLASAGHDGDGNTASSLSYHIVKEDGSTHLNNKFNDWNLPPGTLLLCSLIFIYFVMIGWGGSNLSTLEFVLFWVVSLSVLLIATFIEISHLIHWLWPWIHVDDSWLRPWEWFRPDQDIHQPVVKVRIGIAAGIAFIAVISFGWPALLVVGTALIIFAATRWAKK